MEIIMSASCAPVAVKLHGGFFQISGGPIQSHDIWSQNIFEAGFGTNIAIN
jgi:hypothetical protein